MIHSIIFPSVIGLMKQKCLLNTKLIFKLFCNLTKKIVEFHFYSFLKLY